MFPAISDFLKDTVTEALKKLLQPTSFFPAVVFMCLNLLFIYPSILAHKGNLAKAIVSIGPLWQIIIVVTVLPTISYLILTLNHVIFNVATGESWSTSPTGRFFIWWHKSRRRSLEKEIAKKSARGDRRDELARLIRQFSSDFPDEDQMAPTTLGNILNAPASYLWKRYGMSLRAMWPTMEVVLASEENIALATKIEAEKSSVDFLLALSFVFYFFALEYYFLQPWLQTFTQVVWSFAFVVVAIIIFRSACARARGLSDGIKMAFDLYRDKLHSALQLRPARDRADERILWSMASAWLLSDARSSDLFFESAIIHPYRKRPECPAEISASANVDIKVTDGFVTGWQPSDGKSRSAHVNAAPPTPPVVGANSALLAPTRITSTYDPSLPQAKVELLQFLEYIILVTNQGTSQQPTKLENIFIVISDPRIAQIDSVPQLDTAALGSVNVQGTLVASSRSDKGQDIMWHLDQLPAHSSTALRYRLPFETILRAWTNNPDLSIEWLKELTTLTTSASFSYAFRVTNTSNVTIDLCMFYIYDSRLPTDNALYDPMQGTIQAMPERDPSVRGHLEQFQVDAATNSATRISETLLRPLRQNPSDRRTLIWLVGPLPASNYIDLAYTI